MTDQTPPEAFREFLTEQKVAKTKIDGIVERFETYMPGDVAALVIDNARVAVETIEAYGLEIEIDANGRACRVTEAGQRGTAGVTLNMTTEYYD